MTTIMTAMKSIKTVMVLFLPLLLLLPLLLGASAVSADSNIVKDSLNNSINNSDTDTNEQIFPQRMTAQNLLTYCSSSSLTSVGRKRQRYCWGFISGVEETMRLALNASGQQVFQKVCVPEGVSSRNLAKAYTQYAGHRDADLARPAAEVVTAALANAYACKF